MLWKPGIPGKSGRQYYNRTPWNKNRLRTNSAKNKNSQPQTKIAGSYKGESLFNILGKPAASRKKIPFRKVSEIILSKCQVN